MADAHTAEAHAAEHPSHTRFYVTIGVILAIVTTIEVLITLPEGIPYPFLLSILMVLSVIKGAAVVMFFMHLRGDARIFQFVFIVPFALAAIFVLLFLLLFSTHVGIAG